MAERTDIYENWNPWHGCTKVSPGCKYCYVYRQDEMYGSEISSSECRKTGKEDNKDLDNVNFNMDIFKAFTEGYLKSARCFLTPLEIENLPYAAALFPYMQTVRFLADYINGDTYYKTQYSEHNLVRSKAQFKLLQSVEAHQQEMQAFIAEQLA